MRSRNSKGAPRPRSLYVITKVTITAASPKFWGHRKWWSQSRCTVPERACARRSAIIWRNIMKHYKKELDAILENATREIRDEQIDPLIINRSAARVWERISRQAAEDSSSINTHLEGINTMNSN